jgi:hypothetical protein
MEQHTVHGCSSSSVDSGHATAATAAAAATYQQLLVDVVARLNSSRYELMAPRTVHKRAHLPLW